jgi:AraC-like DNA-binding protein
MASRKEHKEILIQDTHKTALGWLLMAGLGEYVNMPRMPRRSLTYFAGVLVMHGSARFESGTGIKTDVQPGDLMLIFPNVTYNYHTPKGSLWSEFWFLFDGPLFHLWLQSGLISTSQPVLRLGSVNFWRKRLHAITGPLTGSPHDQSLTRIIMLQQFLADAIAHRKQDPAAAQDQLWVQEAMRLLDPETTPASPRTNPTDIDWQSLARTLGLGYEGFRKRFARLTGLSPGQYRTQRIMENAQRLLLRGLSVADAAHAAGFADPFYFSRQFKKHVGVSPTEYRHGFSPH